MDTEKRLNELAGQIAAMNAVLGALLSVITPLQAAKMAVMVEMERQELNNTDIDNDIPDQTADARNLIIKAYLDLLSARSRSQPD
ncbi:hypothetical protein [Xenophilus sp. Marseille-Q4582]|uniref:hypothetical protein n=1 Tax=Xenophilus sp. Marseille-Q4582 TaxID=2866600 RepID=UPI001CE3E3E2|nr:hypothetical protein [Xenophilus sp. Marseille-Q4582]